MYEKAGFRTETYFPGISDLVEQHGENVEELLNMWGHVYWSIYKAKDLLGYQPIYNFPEFYKALKKGRESYYPMQIFHGGEFKGYGVEGSVNLKPTHFPISSFRG